MKEKIIIAGGGTGGHLVPMLSVADALASDYDVVIYTGYGTMISKISGFKKHSVKKILTGKIHRYHSPSAYLKNTTNIVKFIFGVLEAFILLIFERPKLIFSKGGYASLPTVIAGHALRIPIIIHESDLTPGLANKIAMKYATKVGVSFPPENYNISLDKIVYTGHMLRYLTVDKDIKAEIDLGNLPTLLVTGGSQGALTINKSMAKILPDLLDEMNVIHLSGENDFPWLKELGKNFSEKAGRYHLESFSPRIIDYIAVSDLILTRAGSNSLAEIAALKKPAIMIPYAYASAGHQEDNANYVQKVGGGEVILEKELIPELLKAKILSFIHDKEKLKLCGENAFKANNFNGVEAIKDLIKEIIHSGKRN